MFECAVCGSDECREELTDEVFHFSETHFLVVGIPATVCVRCGEQSFSRETAERVRLMLHGGAEPTKTVPMPVFEYAG